MNNVAMRLVCKLRWENMRDRLHEMVEDLLRHSLLFTFKGSHGSVHAVGGASCPWCTAHANYERIKMERLQA